MLDTEWTWSFVFRTHYIQIDQCYVPSTLTMTIGQGIVTQTPPVEAFATGIKWNQAINVLFRSQSRGQDEFWAANINRSTHFLRYLAGVATFCPLNSRRIKRSRASERSNQAIKDDFHCSTFLIPVANTSTGDIDVYVTTPCRRGRGDKCPPTFQWKGSEYY